MKHFLLTLALLCLTLLPVGAGEATQEELYGLDRFPLYVKCESLSDCTRDPQILQNFTLDFYKKYINHIYEHQSPKQLASETLHVRDRYIRQIETDIYVFKTYLSRALYEKAYRTIPLIDSTRETLYPTGLDQILQTEALDKDWRTTAQAEPPAINGESANVIITLPIKTELLNERFNPAIRLLVHLRVIDKHWMIDNVTRIFDTEGSRAYQKMEFHLPRTTAEKNLDEALIFNNDNVFITKHNKRMTRALYNAIQREERKLIKQTCGNHPTPGDLCGFDTNPIICAQDIASPYLYRTLLATPTKVTIALAWPWSFNDHARYTLIKSSNAWKLDGIQCMGWENGKFNMP